MATAWSAVDRLAARTQTSTEPAPETLPTSPDSGTRQQNICERASGRSWETRTAVSIAGWIAKITVTRKRRLSLPEAPP
jgi:hypothetical protein